jgi:hypothetical protein
MPVLGVVGDRGYITAGALVVLEGGSTPLITDPESTDLGVVSTTHTVANTDPGKSKKALSKEGLFSLFGFCSGIPLVES